MCLGAFRLFVCLVVNVVVFVCEWLSVCLCVFDRLIDGSRVRVFACLLVCLCVSLCVCV